MKSNGNNELMIPYSPSCFLAWESQIRGIWQGHSPERILLKVKEIRSFRGNNCKPTVPLLLATTSVIRGHIPWLHSYLRGDINFCARCCKVYVVQIFHVFKGWIQRIKFCIVHAYKNGICTLKSIFQFYVYQLELAMVTDPSELMVSSSVDVRCFVSI